MNEDLYWLICEAFTKSLSLLDYEGAETDASWVRRAEKEFNEWYDKEGREKLDEEIEDEMAEEMDRVNRRKESK